MNAAPTVASLDWVSLTGNFVLVIVLLVAVLWLLRRMQGIKGLQGLRPVARRLSVVEALTVGPVRSWRCFGWTTVRFWWGSRPMASPCWIGLYRPISQAVSLNTLRRTALPWSRGVRHDAG